MKLPWMAIYKGLVKRPVLWPLLVKEDCFLMIREVKWFAKSKTLIAARHSIVNC